MQVKEKYVKTLFSTPLPVCPNCNLMVPNKRYGEDKCRVCGAALEWDDFNAKINKKWEVQA